MIDFIASSRIKYVLNLALRAAKSQPDQEKQIKAQVAKFDDELFKTLDEVSKWKRIEIK